MEGVKELFNTNFLGPVCLIKEVLSEMRKRKSSAIINISSLGALTCNGGSGYYSASKSALEKMSISLRQRLAQDPFGQKGDPYKAAQVIVSTIEKEDYPKMILLGKGTTNLVVKILSDQINEIKNGKI